MSHRSLRILIISDGYAMDDENVSARRTKPKAKYRKISQNIDSWRRFRELVISPEAISEADRASGVGARVVDFAANAVTIVYREPLQSRIKASCPRAASNPRNNTALSVYLPIYVQTQCYEGATRRRPLVICTFSWHLFLEEEDNNGYALREPRVDLKRKMGHVNALGTLPRTQNMLTTLETEYVCSHLSRGLAETRRAEDDR
ncbi:hypothetical protein V1478_006719 [Vespula squamosa]|uniref:Uncharacterized protein n=1 Tax=Vespula squamosa TaxID=30214 RepID=A0ABD2B165_VESSQ